MLLGFDPGGQKTFGWCIVEDADELPLKLMAGGDADNAQEAMAAVLKRLPHHGHILAAGIDSPLFWATSDRGVDGILRQETRDRGVSSAGGTVSIPGEGRA